MPHSLLRWLGLLFIVPFLNIFAWSQCFDPPTPGIVICTPSPGSTVVYVPEVSVRFTPESGAQISRIIVYDNGRVMSNTGRRPGRGQRH